MVDGYTSSVEAQAEGALHVHGSLHVVSKWQHTPIADIADEIATRNPGLVSKLIEYKHNIARETMTQPCTIDIHSIARVEEQLKSSWAREGIQLCSSRNAPPNETLEDWRVRFAADTNAIVSVVNHHIHPRDANRERYTTPHARLCCAN